jgi:hypothetical protein
VDPASVLWISFMGLVTITTAAWIVGVVDCAYRKYPTAREKWVWIVVVVLGHWFGALVYWFVGRQRGRLRPI